jgi:hypothetical protein
VLLHLSVTSGQMSFEWLAEPGRQFSVHWAPEITGPWQTFIPPATSTNALYRFTDDNSQTGGPGSSRFYRVSPVP